MGSPPCEAWKSPAQTRRSWHAPGAHTCPSFPSGKSCRLKVVQSPGQGLNKKVGVPACPGTYCLKWAVDITQDPYEGITQWVILSPGTPPGSVQLPHPDGREELGRVLSGCSPGHF